ncbi:MAG: hypothetical protein RIQ52_1040 [Pseudomonadota bacterium]
MKKIFLVDDSTTVLMSMTDILSRQGYSVSQAGNGEEALQALKALGKVDLVITDVNMPKMNGIELIRELRKMTLYRFTPILVLTTESQGPKRDEGKAAGATGWLVKPVAAPDLLKVIKQVVPGA